MPSIEKRRGSFGLRLSPSLRPIPSRAEVPPEFSLSSLSTAPDGRRLSASCPVKNWLSPSFERIGVSHSQLLLRSPYDAERPNVDLKFVAVDYMDLPASLSEIEVCEAQTR